MVSIVQTSLPLLIPDLNPVAFEEACTVNSTAPKTTKRRLIGEFMQGNSLKRKLKGIKLTIVQSI